MIDDDYDGEMDLMSLSEGPNGDEGEDEDEDEDEDEEMREPTAGEDAPQPRKLIVKLGSLGVTPKEE